MENRTEPTYENQLWHARRLLKEKGIEAVNNPHALIGKDCGCGTCFCCAALQVVNENRTRGKRGKRTEPYTGPFPRGRHSHKCLKCVERGQDRAIACYKKQCTTPQTTETCAWCSPSIHCTGK